MRAHRVERPVVAGRALVGAGAAVAIVLLVVGPVAGMPTKTAAPARVDQRIRATPEVVKSIRSALLREAAALRTGGHRLQPTAKHIRLLVEPDAQHQSRVKYLKGVVTRDG